MRVTVRYFSAHREMAGVADEMLEVPDDTTVGDLLARLVAIHPRLVELLSDTVVSVNRGVGAPDVALADGDDVALFPPISGG